MRVASFAWTRKPLPHSSLSKAPLGLSLSVAGPDRERVSSLIRYSLSFASYRVLQSFSDALCLSTLLFELQLLGSSSGFQVASTHKPCTKGLWMWSAPLRQTALDGTEYSLLLLDSEGIDAYDQTVSYQFSLISLYFHLCSIIFAQSINLIF